MLNIPSIFLINAINQETRFEWHLLNCFHNIYEILSVTKVIWRKSVIIIKGMNINNQYPKIYENSFFNFQIEHSVERWNIQFMCFVISKFLKNFITKSRCFLYVTLFPNTQSKSNIHTSSPFSWMKTCTGKSASWSGCGLDWKTPYSMQVLKINALEPILFTSAWRYRILLISLPGKHMFQTVTHM